MILLINAGSNRFPIIHLYLSSIYSDTNKIAIFFRPIPMILPSNTVILKIKKPFEIERPSYINQPKNLIFDLTCTYSKKDIQRTKTN